MSHIILSQWEWQDTDPEEPPFWRAPGPDKVTGLIDLRSNPSCGTPGGVPQGFGLFTYDTPQTGMAVDLGADIEGQLRVAQISGLETELGLAPGTILSTRLSDVIAELLIVHPEISGDTRWKPLRGSFCGGEAIFLQPFGKILQRSLSNQVRTNTVNIFQSDYRRNLAVGVPDITLRKWTGSKMLSIWGRMSDEHADELMPPEHRAKGWERPTTTLTESFNQADSTTVGPDQTWTEVAGDIETVSNECHTVNESESSYGRVGTDLSSDAHYVQGTTAIANVSVNSFKQWGPCARFQVDANTSYMFMRQFKDSLTVGSILRLRKTVTGTRSDLGTEDTSATVVDEVVKIEHSALDVLRGLLDDVEKDSITDTAIQDNLRTGLFMFAADDGHVACDVWEAEDLPAVGGAGIRNPFGGPMVLRKPLGA